MPGVRMKVRGVLGNVFDNFNRTSNPIEGSSTTIGGKAWVKQAAGDCVVQATGGALRATAGEGSDMYLIDAGSANYSVSFTVSSLRSGTALPSMAFRATSEADHNALLLRIDSVTPGYVLTRRRFSSYTHALVTSVIPRVGDRVTITANGDNVELFVNGQSLGVGILEGWADKPLLGFRMFGTDVSTSFDDLSVFTV